MPRRGSRVPRSHLPEISFRESALACASLHIASVMLAVQRGDRLDSISFSNHAVTEIPGVEGVITMGMFDSFLVKIDNKQVELQSKRFDQVLAQYRIGDVVSGSPVGVRVYLERVGFDAEGRHVYDDEDVVQRWTVLLVLAHTLFVDYELADGDLGTEETLLRIRGLEEQWEDSARLLNRLIKSLAEKQARIEQLEGQINHARGAIDETRRIRAGEAERHGLLPVWEYTKRLHQGEDPLGVLEWVLGDGYRDEFGSGSRIAERGPLDEYLL